MTRNVLCQFDGCVERRAGGDDSVDESVVLRFGDVEFAAGENEVECAAKADDAWQADGAAVDECRTLPSRGGANGCGRYPRKLHRLNDTRDEP